MKKENIEEAEFIDDKGQYDYASVYEWWSVHLSRTVLLAAWLLLYTAIARVFAIFVATQVELKMLAGGQPENRT